MVMSEASSGLIDIIEPAAPLVNVTASWLWPLLLLAILVIVMGILFVLWKYKLPAYRAIKRVRGLQRKLHAAENTPHETLLMLALELRHGLGLKQLRAQNLPARCSRQDCASWPEFMQYLDGLLYQHDAELTEEKLADLFVQVEYWLRRYGRQSKLKKFGE
jgi:hypothetical protein